jgi:hypothetical protein
MGRRKPIPPRRTVQLELFPQVALPAPASGMWKQVEELPATAERFHLERTKLVRRKLHQTSIMEVDSGAPDAGSHGAQGDGNMASGAVPLAPERDP